MNSNLLKALEEELDYHKKRVVALTKTLESCCTGEPLPKVNGEFITLDRFQVYNWLMKQQNQILKFIEIFTGLNKEIKSIGREEIEKIRVLATTPSISIYTDKNNSNNMIFTLYFKDEGEDVLQLVIMNGPIPLLNQMSPVNIAFAKFPRGVLAVSLAQLDEKIRTNKLVVRAYEAKDQLEEGSDYKEETLEFLKNKVFPKRAYCFKITPDVIVIDQWNQVTQSFEVVRKLHTQKTA